MPVGIPLRVGLPKYSLQQQLDNVTYTLEVTCNVRLASWFLNVLDSTSSVLLLAGIRLVTDWALPIYVTGRQPPGFFFLEDTSGNGADPDFDGMGARWQLRYFSAAELAQIGR